jgi:hypothetical protein
VFFICEILQTPCFKKISSDLLRIEEELVVGELILDMVLDEMIFFKKEDKKLSQVDRNINMIFVIKI